MIFKMIENDKINLQTVESVAELLMTGKGAVYQLLATGELKAFKIGRVWKIPMTSIVNFVNKKIGEKSTNPPV